VGRFATGFAIDGEVATTTRWDRKNYFYPDIPKGYQISQYQLPLVANGKLTFDTSDGPFTVRVRRAHLEEDTGRPDPRRPGGSKGQPRPQEPHRLRPLRHAPDGDRHRADIRTGEQARRYAEELRLLMRTIGASDAEMENGQMRVEANVSIRRSGARHSDARRSQEHELDALR